MLGETELTYQEAFEVRCGCVFAPGQAEGSERPRLGSLLSASVAGMSGCSSKGGLIIRLSCVQKQVFLFLPTFNSGAPEDRMLFPSLIQAGH